MATAAGASPQSTDSASDSATSSVADSTPSTSIDALRSWFQTRPLPPLLDLRCPAAFRQRRLGVDANVLANEDGEGVSGGESMCRCNCAASRSIPASTSIHWRQLEDVWFMLPPYGCPFAVMLPGDDPNEKRLDDDAVIEVERFEQQRQKDGIKARHMHGPENDARPDSASASSISRPVLPSDPSFRPTRSSLVSLLRFYGWVIPDEWVMVSNDALWSAVASGTIPRLRVLGSNDAVESRRMFEPAEVVRQEKDRIEIMLREAWDVRGDAWPTPALPDSNRVSKQPRLTDSMSANSHPSHSDTADSAVPKESITLRCLDVACGSGRDLCWLLSSAHDVSARRSTCTCSPVPPPTLSSSSSHSSSASPSSLPLRWVGVGVDSNTGALERVHRLASELNIESDRIQTVQARINQGTGEWSMKSKEEQVGSDNISQECTTASSESEGGSSSLPANSSPTTPPPEAAVSSAPTKLTQGQLRKLKARQKKEAKRAAHADATAADPSNSPSDSPPVPFLTQQYDLILMIRFLSRSFIRLHLNKLLAPGGIFLLSTFIDDTDATPPTPSYDHPANQAFRIKGRKELVQLLEKEAGLELVRNDIGYLKEDGRPVSVCVARKPIATQQLNSK